MKRILLAGTIACTVGLLSCTKEKTVTVTNTVHDTTTLTIWPSGQINGDSLSAGLKLAYSATVNNATFPAASTSADAPALDSLFDRTYTASKGGLLTIYPANTRGYVKGYYVQIVGAKSYFNVDLSLANSLRKKRAEARAAKTHSKDHAVRGNGEGYVDGILAFEIPASLNGDTFYVKYAAYDQENRVSNSTIATVVLLPSVSNAIVDSLKGTWDYKGYKNYSYGQLNESWTPPYSYEYNYNTYSCTDNVLTQDPSGSYYLPYYKRNDYTTFTFNGSQVSYSYRYIYSDLNLSLSTCSDTVYNENEESYSYTTLGYTFDAKSRKITIYYSDDDDSNLDIFTETYRISSLSAKELILFYYSDDDDSDGQFTWYTKK
jgi:hypothetical protein